MLKFTCFTFSILVICSLSLISKSATVFNSPRQFSLPAPQAAIASGDLNNDGILDLVIGGDPAPAEFAKIRVLLGKGNGNFQLSGEYRVGYEATNIKAFFVVEIKIGDLNNDGNLDVAVGHNNGRTQINDSPLLATVLLGNGNGTLQERDSYIFFTTGADFVVALDLADFNNDGLLDVLIGCRSGSRGTIFGLRNVGAGNFTRIGPSVLQEPVQAMVPADINGDSISDVVVTTSRGLIVLYSNGVFFASGERIGEKMDVFGLTVADFNSDGRPDIAVTDTFEQNIRLFLKRPRGYPAVPIVYPIPFVSGYLKSIDFNRDGNTDMICLDGYDGLFQILYGDGIGSFPTSEIKRSGVALSDIVFADFDSNGKIDIGASLSAEPPAKQAAIFLNAPNTARYYSDFDGDVMSDLTVYRPGTGTWWTLPANNASYRVVNFGLPTDRIVPGNYDGDNKADIGVYRNGVWYILHTSDNSLRIDYWGTNTDVPVPSDYDNDGKMNLAVFRPSEGIWYVKNDIGFNAIYWGLNSDKPVPNDYDGDGKTDMAVWRPSTGIWYVLRSSDGNWFGTEFGKEQFGDIPVPADYDGDGKADIAVWRPSEGNWYALQSTSGFSVTRWGAGGDVPVQADYDGDGKSDIAVWRPNESKWYVLKSSNGSFSITNWGTFNDIPVKSH